MPIANPFDPNEAQISAGPQGKSVYEPKGFPPLDYISELIHSVLGALGPSSPDITETAMPGASKAVQSAYRDFIKRQVKQPVELSELPSDFAKMVEKIIRGGWFHGTDVGTGSQILRKGFDPSRVGERFSLRFGEPSGVSLTTTPTKAYSFGADVLRVAPTMKPSQIQPAWGEQVHKKLVESYIDALNKTSVKTPSGDELFNTALKMEDFAKLHNLPFMEVVPKLFEMNKMRRYIPTGQQSFFASFPKLVGASNTKEFNTALSEALRSREIEGLLYNPKRYFEGELRVLDTKKAIPLELMSVRSEGGGPRIGSRYSRSKADLGRKFEEAMGSQPLSLNETYKKIPLGGKEGGLVLPEMENYQPSVPFGLSKEFTDTFSFKEWLNTHLGFSDNVIKTMKPVELSIWEHKFNKWKSAGIMKDEISKAKLPEYDYKSYNKGYTKYVGLSNSEKDALLESLGLSTKIIHNPDNLKLWQKAMTLIGQMEGG